MHQLRVASSSGGGLTIERDETIEYAVWDVRLEVPNLAASGHRVDAAYGPAGALARYFASLASDWRGWTGERAWQAVDGTLRFTATHDGLGHIALQVHLHEGVWLDAWQARATLNLEAGALDALAADAARFEETSTT